jgi:hypothetical protein
MLLLILQFGLMGLNLYFAKEQTKQGRNPGFQYFVAGMCFLGGIHALINLIS